MADNELLPCPFCGGAPRWLNDLGLSCYLQCTGCGVDNNRELQTKELAAERWNRRAPKAEGLAAPAVRSAESASHPHPEVTPEMIEAGVKHLHPDPHYARESVAAIYVAMEKARRA